MAIPPGVLCEDCGTELYADASCPHCDYEVEEAQASTSYSQTKEIMIYFMRVHLVNGTSMDGVPEEVTQEDLDKGKPILADTIMGSGGWQVNIELPNGGWACFPKQGVLFIEMIKKEA